MAQWKEEGFSKQKGVVTSGSRLTISFFVASARSFHPSDSLLFSSG